MAFSQNRDCYAVVFAPRLSCCSLILASFASGFCAINSVLKAGRWPDILSRIVESITISMIVFRRFWQTCPFSYFAMQEHASLKWAWRGSLSVPQPSVSGLDFHSVPLEFHCPFVINGVHNGELSLRERNEAGISLHSSLFSSAGLFTRHPRCFFKMLRLLSFCQP